MNALWNKKDLERPANNIWVANRKAIDLKRFVSALESIIKDLDSQSALHMEAAILSRLIYRMKSKFRSDKGLKNMEKVNRALLNYLDIKLLKEYKDLRNYVELDGLVVNLPTKQMVQYVLVRTQGFAKLMSRIENVAKYAAEFFKTRINIGHAWTVSVIAYAVVSRVWYLSRYLLKRCCAWYNSVIDQISKFKQIGPRWLPDDYDLPLNLKTWLNLPWIDQATDSVPLKDDGKETIFGLIRAQIDDPCDLNIENEDLDLSSIRTSNDLIEVIENSSEIDREIPENQSRLTAVKPEVSFFADDIGMSIDRETFQSTLAAEVSNTKNLTESKENLQSKKDEVSISGTVLKDNSKVITKAGAKKSKALITEDNISPVPVKKRKKVSRNEAKESVESFESNETSSVICKKRKKQKNQTEKVLNSEKATVKSSKLKLAKAKKKSLNISSKSSAPDEKTKHSTPRDIKTRDDLARFLSKDSYPGLDRLQWNMLINSVKKFSVKLEKCGPSDERRQKILLKKVNSQIKNWIH